MTKSYLPLISLIFMANVLLSGCATKLNSSSDINNHALNPAQRAAQLLKNKQWHLRGKIAFIEKIPNQKDKRESASIAWQVNEKAQTQTLNLTSYLGINVLQLESKKNQHLIKVDGKEYRGDDLDQLIYSLTGLTLPTKALTYWLKGLPYSANDILKNNPDTQLPMSITSYFNNSLWQIKFGQYKTFNGIKMATKFTIEKNGLLIKVAVKKWSFEV